MIDLLAGQSAGESGDLSQNLMAQVCVNRRYCIEALQVTAAITRPNTQMRVRGRSSWLSMLPGSWMSRRLVPQATGPRNWRPCCAALALRRQLILWSEPMQTALQSARVCPGPRFSGEPFALPFCRFGTLLRDHSSMKRSHDRARCAGSRPNNNPANPRRPRAKRLEMARDWLAVSRLVSVRRPNGRTRANGMARRGPPDPRRWKIRSIPQPTRSVNAQTECFNPPKRNLP
jgi:hypothetical protein